MVLRGAWFTHNGGVRIPKWEVHGGTRNRNARQEHNAEK